MVRLKFSLRSFVVSITAIAILLGLWIRTYSVRGYYPNGQLAWEQFENRTILMNVNVSKRVTWYPSGTMSAVWTPTYVTYYSPSGEVFLGNDSVAVKKWATEYSYLLRDAIVTDFGARPFEKLLLWFNPKIPKIKSTL